MTLVYRALRAAADTLALSGVPDPAVDAALLLSFVTGKEPLRLRAEGSTELDAEQEAAFDCLVRRRASREPLQYILGDAPFMGRMFKVTPDTLIPRADTEILCARALERLGDGMRALDLCTGTGILAITMACERPRAQVLAGDVSPAALAVARENAHTLGAEVEYRRGDLFASFAGERFHVIVSNPPYICKMDMENLQEEVRREPALALYGGADGLDFYRRIAREAPEHLFPGGYLLLEIGCDEGAAVAELLRGAFRDIRVLPDLRGLDRVVEARLLGEKYKGGGF